MFNGLWTIDNEMVDIPIMMNKITSAVGQNYWLKGCKITSLEPAN